MKKIASYVKAHKTAGYLFLSILILVLLVAVCSFTVFESTLQSHVIDRASLESSAFNGYDVRRQDDGTSVWIPNSDDPRIYLSSPSFEINCVRMSFDQPLLDKTYVQLYYATDESIHSYGILSDEGQTELVFFIPEGLYTSLSISTDETFPLGEICFSKTVITPQRQLNLIPLVILIVLIVLLFVFEPKIGYITYLRKELVAIIDRIKSFGCERRWFVLTLYLLKVVSTVLYTAVLTLLLLFSYFTAKSVVLLFWTTVVTLLFQLLYRLCLNKNSEPAKFFLIIALLVGFLFAYAFPITTGVMWDDQIHYYRTELTSRILFGHQRTFADYAQAINVYSSNMAIEQIEETLQSIIWMDQQDYHLKGYFVNFYAYIAYFHNSFLIFLSDLLSIDFILQMILMKMANVAVYAFVVYRGIRKLKSGAYLASAICLMPTAMFMASTINYDFWVTCFLIYAFAAFISELQQPEKKLTFKEALRIPLAVFVGCGPKAIYFLLLLPFLFFPKEKFHRATDQKKYRNVCIILAVVIMLSFVLPFLIRTDLATDERGGDGVNAPEQVKFILTSPFQYAKILIDFVIDYMSPLNALGSTGFFAYLGGAGGLTATISVCLILFCAFVDKKECDFFQCAGWFCFATFITVMVEVVLIATALYVSFTPLHSSTINGCQWRYLIPLLFPMFYSLSGRCAVRTISDRKMSVIVYGLLCVSLIGSFYEVYLSSLLM